jgi:hypothetical protein
VARREQARRGVEAAARARGRTGHALYRRGRRGTHAKAGGLAAAHLSSLSWTLAIFGPRRA